MTLLGVALHCAWYGLIERLPFSRKVSGGSSSGALLYVPLGLIRSWCAFGICRLLRNTAVDPVLALVAIWRLIRIDWKASEN